ncbi:hypothetical protein KFE25_009190 [Diacronema lutheri]|uniref:Ribosomal RNA-processing protein 12-like conserved domain-containing protein n=1 Tax=Diacronema lutheri TaxID=2081491 RepID=A0A8J6CFJ4_DIALT|nr:hypothetical protein KFE25_009190 [Diacronema lutheri]
MDVFAEITVHPKKFKEENAVLAAMREVILAQGIEPSPLAVVGTIVTGLSARTAVPLDQSDEAADASSTGAQLAVLHVACKGVSLAVLQRRAEQLVGALASAIARHAQAPCVLKPATACAGQLLRALGNGAGKPASDAQRLHRWLLGLALHTNAKVRSKAQHTVASLALAVPALGAPTGRFVSRQLEGANAAVGAAGGAELQPLFYALNLGAQVLPALPRAQALAMVSAVCQLPALRQPLLTQVAADALIPALSGGGCGGGGGSGGGHDDDDRSDDDAPSAAAAAAAPLLPAEAALCAYEAFAAVRAEGSDEPRVTVVAATRAAVRAACCALRTSAAGGADAPLLERANEQARACVSLLLVRMQHEDEPIARAASDGLRALASAAGAAANAGVAAAAAGVAPSATALAPVRALADALCIALSERFQPVRAQVLVTCAQLLREAPLADGTADAVAPLVARIAALRAQLADERDVVRARRIAKQRKRRAERAGAVELLDRGGALAAAAEDEVDDSSAQSELGHALRALGAAAECLGLRAFLSVVPLHHAESRVTLAAPDGSAQAAPAADTTFLLPLLCAHVGRRAELSFFASHLLPFADGLIAAARAQVGADGAPTVLGRTCQLLCVQTWTLLPPICAAAEDGAVAIPLLARRMGEACNNTPELRPPICAAFSALVHANVARTRGADALAAAAASAAAASAPPAAVTAAADAAARAAAAAAALETLGGFSPKLLPILFNVHAVTAADSRAPLEQAITALASVSASGTLSSFFRAVLAKLIGQSADGDAPAQPPSAKRQGELLELAIALAPHLDAPNALLLWRLARPQLQLSTAPAVQKKAYRATLALLGSAETFGAAHADDVRAALLEAGASCAAAARHVRLQALSRCYACVRAAARSGGATGREAAALSDAPALLSELMLATKEPNLKTRAVAYDGLLLLAEDARRRGQLAELLGLVAAGLAGGSGRMVAASLHTIARIAMAHRRTLPAALERGALCSLLVGSPLLLTAHESVEVSRAALVLLRVSAVVAPVDLLNERCAETMRSLCALLDGDAAAHHLHAVRVLLERLGRRLGFDVVEPHVPRAHAPLVQHVRKQWERHERKRASRKEGRRAHAQSAAGHFTAAPDGADGDDDDDDAALLRGDSAFADADMAAAAEEEALLNALGLDRKSIAPPVDRANGVGARGAHAGGGADGADGAHGDLLQRPVHAAKAAAALSRRARAQPERDGGTADARKRRRSGDDDDDDDDDGGDDGDDAVAMGADGILRLGKAAASARANAAAAAAADVAMMDAEAHAGAHPRAGVGARPAKLSKRSRALDAEALDPLGMASAPEVTAAQLEGAAHLTLPRAADAATGRAAQRGLQRGGKSKPTSFGEYLGDEFKPRKPGTSGDVRRPDGQQPYAYMPLNPRLLSKKHKHRAAETMDQFVRHGKRLAGSKAKAGKGGRG